MASAGTVTFLFTDIERSSSLWEAQREEMPAALELHDEVLRNVFASRGGRPFKHTGDGLCAAFDSVSAAVHAAVEGQQALLSADWPTVSAIGVRMGIHTGEAQQRDGDYFGAPLNRCARVMDAGHAGQILLSEAAERLLRDGLPADIQVRDLGEHELKGLKSAERLFQLDAPGLRHEFPPLRTAATERRRLPSYRSVFVGRREAMDQLAGLVEKHRLLTLTGIGGCGKTRLAVELADRVADAFSDGVFFVDLAPISDGDLVTSSAIAAVGLQLGGGIAGGGGDLLDWLRARSVLLVVDNCEHMLDATAAFVEDVLQAAPAVRVLATSREPLEVEGERTWRVPSLSAEGGLRSEAGALFLDRARAVRPDLELGEADLDAVNVICERLDGIPLAIELAAARVSHLSPREVAARLDDRFRLLTGGRRRVQRQQTLEAALDWSYDLLTTDEQVVLRRLGVFPADFGLDAAESICGEGVPSSVVDVLGALVRRSLVLAEDREGATRYRLLESVRAYASSKLLEAGEAERVRDRHAQWCLDLLHDWTGVGFLDFFDVIRPQQEIANLRGALEWLRIQERDAELAELIRHLVGYWWFEGAGEEPVQWAQPLLDKGTVSPAAESDLRLALGVAAMARGDFLEMERQSALALASAGPVAAVRALCLQLLFWTYVDLGKAEERVAQLVEITGKHDLGRAATAAESFVILVDIERGELDEAVRRLDRVLSGPVLGYGEWASAYAATAIHHMGGEHERAARAAALMPAAHDGRMNRYMRILCAALGQIGLGRLEEARRTIASATEAARRDGTALAENDCLLHFAIAAYAEGDARRARKLLVAGFSSGGFRRSPVSVLLARHYRALVAAALSDDERRSAGAEGAALGVSAALDEELARLV